MAEIARRLGVARGTVSNWHGLWKHGGVAALASSPPPRLTAARLAPIREALDRGPQASGYPTDVWTLAQVTEVIERLTGVRYEPNRVRRILRDRMGWEADRLVSMRTYFQGAGPDGRDGTGPTQLLGQSWD